jgi:hypothetical protein
MGFGRHLRRRRHTWFFRFRWPPQLAACGVSGEFIRSLKTGDYRVALRRALVLMLRIEAMLQTVSKLPTKQEAEAQVRSWIDKCLWRQEIHRAETGGFEWLELDEIELMGREEAAEVDGLIRLTDTVFGADQKKTIERALRGQEPMDQFNAVIAAAARETGKGIDPSTTEGRLLGRTFLRGMSTLLDELRDTVATIPRQVSSGAPSVAAPSFRFTESWKQFEVYKVDNRQWKRDTAVNARGSLNIFDRLFPGATVAQIVSSPIASDFKTKLLLLPRAHSQGDFKLLSVEELIAAGRKMPVSKKVQDGTVNKHFANMIEHWNFLVREKKIPEGIKNPFVGYHIPRKKGRKARDQRFNWPKDLERKFFSSPVYRGCASIYRRTKTGDGIYRDALFWMPLLGRTMGTREYEICDALVGSVKTIETNEGEIVYLEIVEGKDTGSGRDVPFADLTLDMGFLEQRVIERRADEPLFPELIKQGAEGRRSAAFTGKFTYYRTEVGCYREKIDFHSYRGDVETALKNLQGINSAWIDELIGHESTVRRSEGERYTKEIYLPILRRMVNSITINADLIHLRYKGQKGIKAPGRDKELELFTALAEKEMRKKAPRRRSI